MSYHLGIDLGTTYTAAATHEGGRVEVVALGDRGPSIPSVLYIKPDGQIVAGDAANRHAVTDPERVAREFKRRLGDPTPVQFGGVPTSPEQLTAHLLRWVYDTVTRAKGSPPATLVLTHPANWGPYKRDLLVQAVQAAGLAKVTLVTEPQAAAISYASQERVEAGAVIAVYDLGGGTFDAAVLRKEADGTFSILGTPEGIERLGGLDFDAAVFNHVTQALEGVFDELDPDDEAAVAAVARLRQECTQAKEALSLDTEATVPVLLPNTQTEVRTTRTELENMIRPPLAETVTALERALRSANLQPADVSHVLLVGGSSRMPIVSQMVSGELGRPTAVDAHPKHAVALGAAIVAAREAGNMVGDAAITAAQSAAMVGAGAPVPPPVTASAGGPSLPPPPPRRPDPPAAPAPSPPPQMATGAPPPPPPRGSAPPPPPRGSAPPPPGPPGSPAPPGPAGPPPGAGFDPTFDAARSEVPPPSLGYRSASAPPPPGASNDLPPGYLDRQERERQQRKDKRKNRVGMVVGAVIFVVLIVATLAITAKENEPTTLADVAQRECFLGTDLGDLEIVECSEAHHGELVAIQPPVDPNVAFPGVDVLTVEQGEACAVNAEAYFGAPRVTLQEQGLNVYPIYPTEDQWNDDLKDTYCYVGSSDSDKTISGSIEGDGAELAPPAPPPGG